MKNHLHPSFSSDSVSQRRSYRSGNITRVTKKFLLAVWTPLMTQLSGYDPWGLPRTPLIVTLLIKISTRNLQGIFLGDINDDPVLQVSDQEPQIAQAYPMTITFLAGWVLKSLLSLLSNFPQYLSLRHLFTIELKNKIFTSLRAFSSWSFPLGIAQACPMTIP